MLGLDLWHLGLGISKVLDCLAWAWLNGCPLWGEWMASIWDEQPHTILKELGIGQVRWAKDR